MKKVQEFEAYRDMQIEASFLPMKVPGMSPQNMVGEIMKVLEKMDNLSEEQKNTSVAELLIFGESKTSGISISN